MEFRFDVCRVLTERVTILSGGKRPTEKGKELDRQLETIIDNMGSASAKAQGLKSPITTYSKLVQSDDQCLYILRENYFVVGFIKTGRRRLFLWDHTGLIHEVIPVCILDFYVHESQQRKGYGKYLFEQVLQLEGLQPFEVAIDRPSTKFLKFLQKHYNLHSHIKQNNNYVVFKKFFSTCVHYDHGHRQVHKRFSLPNNIEGPPCSKNMVDNRLSVSPKSPSFSKMDENLPPSGQSSFYSLATPSSKNGSEINGSDECQLVKKHSFNNIIRNEPSNEETFDKAYWSEHVKAANPVSSNRHAPFLTMRSQPRQRSLNSFFGSDNCFPGSVIPGYHTNDRYSKYDIGFGLERKHPLPRTMTNPFRQETWCAPKRCPWKEHL